MQNPAEAMASQKGSVVAKCEMVRAPNRNAQPPIWRQAIINGLDVSFDLTDLRVGRKIAFATSKKHEWSGDAELDDAAVQRTVDIDGCLASRILRTELRGLRPAKGMTKYSYPRHVKPSCEPARRIRCIQLP